MSTFDGSTAASAPDRSQHYDNDFPPPESSTPGIHYVATPPTFDAFESLREQIAERDDEEERTTVVEVPGIGWRLVCAIDFEYTQYKEWQKAALPKSQRNGRKVNPLDMDQAMLAYFVLYNTCEAIEYLRDVGDGPSEWEPLTEDSGEPATLKSGKLLTLMNVMDPRLLVKRMFGKGDARLIAAGQEVIMAAGYGEREDSTDDPSDPTP